MTLQEYKIKRKLQDKEDYKFYLGEFKYFCKIMLSVVIGYIVVGATMAIFS